ncbi:MAG: hypothetical protein Q8K70_08430 [Bacteroidota bacterium]|nr:hypothetical protein [Bacteroidota bacterium]
MKHLIILMSVFAIGINDSYAQESNSEASIKNKKGVEVLPQAGDWSFGIAANPFLDYAGNLMNNNSYNSAPNFRTTNSPNSNVFDNVGGNNIFVKYAQSQSLFLRARVIANTNRYSFSNAVRQDVMVPNLFTTEYVYDKQIYKNSNFLIGLGFEKRKGSTRLQGLYGAELILGTTRSSESFEYGNPMNIDFPTPLTYNYGNALSRPLESKNGTSFAFGARGFIGVEYFFAPKISIGGEIGYTIGLQTNSRKTTYVEERFNPETLQAERVVMKSSRNGGLSYSGMGLDNTSSSLSLNFYF